MKFNPAARMRPNLKVETMNNVYLQFTKDQINATLALLRWFHAFLASNCDEARDPISGFGFYLTKPEAKCKLSFLLHVAINRKAGIPDYFGRKDDPDYQMRLRRDRNRLQDIANRIRVYQFENEECKSRFSHLL